MQVLVLNETRVGEVGYHFTTLDSLGKILKSNTMKATNPPIADVFDEFVGRVWERKSSPREPYRPFTIPGSDELKKYEQDYKKFLKNSKKFSKSYTWSYTRSKNGYNYRHVSDMFVRIAFDIEGISRKQSVFPYSVHSRRKDDQYFEYEERIVGDTPNIINYIKEISFNPLLNPEEKYAYQIKYKIDGETLNNNTSFLSDMNMLERFIKFYNSNSKKNLSLYSKLDNLLSSDNISPDKLMSELLKIKSNFKSFESFSEDLYNHILVSDSNGLFIGTFDYQQIYENLLKVVNEMGSKAGNFAIKDLFKKSKIDDKVQSKYFKEISDFLGVDDFREFLTSKGIKISYIDTARVSNGSKNELSYELDSTVALDSNDSKKSARKQKTIFSEKIANSFLSEFNKVTSKAKLLLSEYEKISSQMTINYSKKSMDLLKKILTDMVNSDMHNNFTKNVLNVLKNGKNHLTLLDDGEKFIICLGDVESSLNYLNKFSSKKTFNVTDFYDSGSTISRKYSHYNNNYLNRLFYYFFYDGIPKTVEDIYLFDKLGSYYLSETPNIYFIKNKDVYECKLSKEYIKISSEHSLYNFRVTKVPVNQFIKLKQIEFWKN